MEGSASGNEIGLFEATVLGLREWRKGERAQILGGIVGLDKMLGVYSKPVGRF